MSSNSHDEILERIVKLEEKVNSRKLPATIFLALGLQTAGAIWWASDISAAVKALESDNMSELAVQNFIAEREKAYLEMDNSRHLAMSERVTRIEGNYQYIEKSLERIEKKLMLIGTEKMK